jgi:hypothetical protein
MQEIVSGYFADANKLPMKHVSTLNKKVFVPCTAIGLKTVYNTETKTKRNALLKLTDK